MKQQFQLDILRQHYVTLARQVLPNIPADCPDGRCLSLLRRHTQKMILFLSLFTPSFNKDQEGMRKACLFYLTSSGNTGQPLQKVKDSYSCWLEMQFRIFRNKSFIAHTLQSYRRMADDLERLKPRSIRKGGQGNEI